MADLGGCECVEPVDSGVRKEGSAFFVSSLCTWVVCSACRGFDDVAEFCLARYQEELGSFGVWRCMMGNWPLFELLIG